jgi:spectrin alpha
MMEYRSRLGESQTLQDFSRDAEEIEAWIADKLAAASDEPVKETQNLQVNINSPPPIRSRVHNHNKHLEMYIYRRKNYK